MVGPYRLATGGRTLAEQFFKVEMRKGFKGFCSLLLKRNLCSATRYNGTKFPVGLPATRAMTTDVIPKTCIFFEIKINPTTLLMIL